MDCVEQALDTWRINNRLNLYLLEAVEPENLTAKVPKGKTVGNHFGHIHNVRLMWLKQAAPELLAGMEKIEDPSDKSVISSALESSGAAIEVLLKQGLEAGRIKGFKPHAIGFLGYLIAHEAYHRAQADLSLRIMGSPLPDKVHYGVWEWGVR